MKYDHTIKVEVECEYCKGTGVYMGMAERNGAAVVCSGCYGTGKSTETFQWNDFKGKKENKKAKIVFASNCGFCIGISEDGSWTEGGIYYKDWLAGKPFQEKFELRSLSCPAWYYQSYNYDLKPEWKECRVGESFSECVNFKTKHKCWDRFDKEQKGKK